MFPFDSLANSIRRLIGTKKKPIAKKKPFRSTRLEIEFLEAREVPTTGLMAAFNFNAGTGSVLPDVSGNSNNGSLGSATWSTTAHTGDSHSLYFNGSSMVTVGNSASLDLTTGMTLEAWVDPTVVSTTWADVAYKGNNNYYLGASSTHSSDPTTQGMLGGTSEQIYGTSSLKANTWTFLSATYNGSVLDLYVNDVLVSSVSKTGNIMTSTSPLLIGGDTSGDFFTGFMDDLRVYNTALTAAQIKTDMSTPVVSATSQTITVTTPTAAISVGGTVALSATGGGSGNPVTYTIDSSSTGKGTISGSTLTATGAGNIVIDYNQAAGGNYSAAAQVQQTLVVNAASKTSQTISFTAPTSPITYTSGETVSLSATASSGLAVVFTIDSSSTGTGTISGSTLTVTGAGNIVIDANQAGNSTYSAAAQVQKTLVVNAASKTSQTISFTAPTSPITYVAGETISLSATASSGLAVVFTIDSSSTGTGTISGSTLAVTGAGNIVIDANQAGNGTYNAAAQVQQTLVVNAASKTSQTISFTAPASPISYVSGQTVSLSATASSGLAVVFTIDSSSTGTGTISGSTLTITGAGNIVIDANQAGNSTYSAAAQVQKTLVVNKASQTISFTAPASPISYVSGQQISLSGSASSGLAVTFTIDSSSTGTGTISGSTLTVTGAGNIVIDANQAGNGNYSAAAQVQHTLVVNAASKTSQTISFTAPASPISYVSGQTVSLSATASSGLAVTFTIDSSSTGAGTISGSTLTVTGAGNIVIDANQAGNSTYSAAAQVQQTLVVNSSGTVSPITTPMIVTPYLNIPNFGATPTIYSIASGNWNNPAIWSQNRVPTTGDVVDVEPGTTVTYNVNDSTDANVLNTVEVQPTATLTFSTTVSTQMCVANLVVLQGGSLILGTQANPIPATITAQIVFPNEALYTSATTQLTIDDGVATQTTVSSQPANTTIDPEQYGLGLIGLGNVTTYGAAKVAFDTLSANAVAGATVLTFATPVTGWQVGDSLELPDTRQLFQGYTTGTLYSSQAESATIASISANGLSVTLTAALQFSHTGAVNAAGSLVYLPQVEDLTRNVSIHSQSASGTRGYALFTDHANVNINYTSFAGLGRTYAAAFSNTTFNTNGTVASIGTNEENRDAVTFLDLIGPSSPQANGYQFTFNGNVIRCPLTPMPYIWGMNVTNSFYGLIENNVLNNWNAAGIFVDFASSYNVFTGNMVSNISGTGVRTDGDMQGDGFWFGNPNNYITNNIATDIDAAGSDVYSYGFSVDAEGAPTTNLIPAKQGDDPSQPGQSTSVCMNAIPLLNFSGNEVYGATARGFSTWWLGTVFESPDGTAGTLLNNVCWYQFDAAYFTYETANLTINGFTAIADPTQVSNAYVSTVGLYFGDYMTDNAVVENLNIQDEMRGIIVPMNVGRNAPTNTFTIENAVLENVINIDVAQIGSDNGATGLSSRIVVIQNVQFSAPPNTPSSWSVWNIYMDQGDSTGASYSTTATTVVDVTNYNDIANDNFQVYYGSGAVVFMNPANATTLPLVYGDVVG